MSPIILSVCKSNWVQHNFDSQTRLEGAFLALCSRSPKLQTKLLGPFVVKFLNVVIHYNQEVGVQLSIYMVTARKEVAAR